GAAARALPAARAARRQVRVRQRLAGHAQERVAQRPRHRGARSGARCTGPHPPPQRGAAAPARRRRRPGRRRELSATRAAGAPGPDAPARPLLLEGALVLTLDHDGTAGLLPVAVEAGRIAAVGPQAELRKRFARAERMDCTGRILLPGLVNAHLHPELHVLKGAVEELNLHDWDDAEHFDDALALLSSPEGAWIQRAGIRAALADCLLTGTTCVAAYGVTVGADE